MQIDSSAKEKPDFLWHCPVVACQVLSASRERLFFIAYFQRFSSRYGKKKVILQPFGDRRQQ